MKRFIDFLTLITIVLTVLATSWSINSFGQARAQTLHAALDMELPNPVFLHWDAALQNAVTDADVRNSSAPIIKEESTCETFRFLGDQYYLNADDHYVDSCLAEQQPPAETFRFMGDYYRDLPEEKVILNITY